MPLYEYQCDSCQHRFEVIQKYSDARVDTCPKCGGTVKRLLSSPAIQFKGSGWYITDYAKRSGTDSGKESKSSEGESGSGKTDSAKTDSGRPTPRRPTLRRPTRHPRRARRRPRPTDHPIARRCDEGRPPCRSALRSRRARATTAPRRQARCPGSSNTRGTARRDPVAGARSARWRAGTRACCPCRAGCPSPRPRRGAAA